MSAPLPSTLGRHDLESTLGVCFIGYIASLIAYGFTVFQAYVYHSRYPMDDWRIKTTVAVVWIFDTATTGLISHSVYYYLVPSFPFTPGFAEATTTFCLENVFSVVVVYIVQIYYAVRLLGLCKNVILPGIVVFISTASLSLGIVMSVKLFRNPRFMNLATPANKAIIATAHALTYLAALLTFCTLSYYLQSKRNPGAKPLKGWFNVLAALTLARGSVSAIVQFGYVIAFAAMPLKPIWVPFQLVASKIFVNSLLAMLNSRDIYHGQGVNEEDFSTVEQSRQASSSSGSRDINIRFDVMTTKATMNIEVPPLTSQAERDRPGVNFYDATANWDDSQIDHTTDGGKEDLVLVT